VELRPMVENDEDQTNFELHSGADGTDAILRVSVKAAFQNVGRGNYACCVGSNFTAKPQ